MEKISGIVPNSARLASVDMRDAAPVRPGTPRFGRPEGISSLAQKQQMPAAPTTPDQMMPFGQTAQKAAGLQQQQMTWRTKEAQQAQIAAEMSNRFFMKNDRAAQPVQDFDQSVMVSSVPVSSNPAGFKTGGTSFQTSASLRAPVSQVTGQEEDPITLQQPEGLYPKGSFIDRTV